MFKKKGNSLHYKRSMYIAKQDKVLHAKIIKYHQLTFLLLQLKWMLLVTQLKIWPEELGDLKK